MTVAIAHVRHRVSDMREGPWRYTNCGRIFLAVLDYSYEPDRLAHQPARSLCQKCYA